MVTELPKRYWTSLEKACLAFGIINILTSVIGFITAIAMFCTGNAIYALVFTPWIGRSIGHEYNIAREPMAFFGMVAEGFFVVLLVVLIIAAVIVHLVFSALLVAGIRQKDKGFVKAFFYYGVVSVCIGLLYNVPCIVASSKVGLLLGIQIGLFVMNMFFVVQLVYVRKLCRMLENPANNFTHERLNDSGLPTEQELHKI